MAADADLQESTLECSTLGPVPHVPCAAVAVVSDAAPVLAVDAAPYGCAWSSFDCAWSPFDCWSTSSIAFLARWPTKASAPSVAPRPSAICRHREENTCVIQHGAANTAASRDWTRKSEATGPWPAGRIRPARLIVLIAALFLDDVQHASNPACKPIETRGPDTMAQAHPTTHPTAQPANRLQPTAQPTNQPQPTAQPPTCQVSSVSEPSPSMKTARPM